jgi:hypothetical protein
LFKVEEQVVECIELILIISALAISSYSTQVE